MDNHIIAQMKILQDLDVLYIVQLTIYKMFVIIQKC